MATCTKASFISNGACYGPEIIPEQDALEVYLLAAVLAAVGGTDYTGVLTSTLLTDSVDATRDMTPVQRRKAYMYVLYSWASSTKTPAELRDAIKCLRNSTSDQLDGMKLLLQCQIANSAT